MNFILSLPMVLSAILLAAHFIRAGLLPVAAFVLVFPVLLPFREAWIARFAQLILALGALEWVRSLLVIVAERQAKGEPWTRLAIILGAVAVWTGGSALLFYCPSLKRRYRLDTASKEESDIAQQSADDQSGRVRRDAP